MKISIALVVLATMLAAANAHDAAPHANKSAAPAQQQTFGIAGDAAKVDRTVMVSMSDTMRFTPASIDVKRGETVKFVVKNGGKLLHEIVIGTMKDLKEHAALMMKHPGMEHDAPHMAHVQPGKTGSIVWHFNRVGEFNFACLVAGHLEAGMVGTISVK
jgi:uncharacterized cupredoxin-like copper-binding protein